MYPIRPLENEVTSFTKTPCLPVNVNRQLRLKRQLYQRTLAARALSEETGAGLAHQTGSLKRSLRIKKNGQPEYRHTCDDICQEFGRTVGPNPRTQCTRNTSRFSEK